MSMFKILNYPIVRHLLAGGCIVLLLWIFSIAPLQRENEELRENMKEVATRQHELITELAEKDTYRIENKVDGAKIKKGGEIKLIPDTKMEVSNIDASTSVVKEDSTKYRQHWWQLWKKRKQEPSCKVKVKRLK